MKKLLFIAILLSGCGDNNELAVHLDNSTEPDEQVKATRLFSGFSWQIFRMEIKGKSYIVNSAGGIVEEK